jgi:hypothetical protein
MFYSIDVAGSWVGQMVAARPIPDYARGLPAAVRALHPGYPVFAGRFTWLCANPAVLA